MTENLYWSDLSLAKRFMESQSRFKANGINVNAKRLRNIEKGVSENPLKANHQKLLDNMYDDWSNANRELLSIPKTNIHPIRTKLDKVIVNKTMKKWITETWMSIRPKLYKSKHIEVKSSKYIFNAVWIEKNERHKGYYRRTKTTNR